MEVKTSLIHLGKLKVTEDYQKAILLVFVHGFNVFPQFYFVAKKQAKISNKSDNTRYLNINCSPFKPKFFFLKSLLITCSETTSLNLHKHPPYCKYPNISSSHHNGISCPDHLNRNYLVLVIFTKF
jgi:hypothetical protein